MDLQGLVRGFNALPRSSKNPSGLTDNYRQFSMHHVSVEPSGDLLHFTNPGSHFTHAEGPAQIPVHKSASERADTVLPMMLKTFTSSMTKSTGNPSAKPYAPWSWGTDDVDLAKAWKNDSNPLEFGRSCRSSSLETRKASRQRKKLGWACSRG
ncbi:hypothetical protein DL98DRAFT_610408 [Cadophora sp. DSE1049]|nr:hypothetical protein DL98DRAFT_610408 [Cadophora sp. DSE1049]